MADEHHYIKKKIRSLRGEYKRPDGKSIISKAGGKCSLCNRGNGETYLFGPTHYLKKQISFKVHIHIHSIAADNNVYPIVICDGCHLAYHLFNRLDPSADFGGKTIKNVQRRSGIGR